MPTPPTKDYEIRSQSTQRPMHPSGIRAKTTDPLDATLELSRILNGVDDDDLGFSSNLNGQF